VEQRGRMCKFIGPTREGPLYGQFGNIRLMTLLFTFGMKKKIVQCIHYVYNVAYIGLRQVLVVLWPIGQVLGIQSLRCLCCV